MKSRAATLLLVTAALPLTAGCPRIATPRGFVNDSYAWFANGGAYLGVDPCVSPDGKWVAYSSPRTGRGDIYLTSLDGKTTKRLTSTEECDVSPRFSPDSKEIAFVRQGSDALGPPRGHLWTIKADGTGPAPLTRGAVDDTDPAYTPDAKAIWFARTSSAHHDGMTYLYEIDRRTRVERQMLTTPVGNSGIGFLGRRDDFVFSPYIPGMSGGDIHRKRPTGKSALIATDGWNVAVSPDGKQIAFVSNPYGQTLWVCGTDGSLRTQIYENGRLTLFSPTFTPDGRSVIVYETNGVGLKRSPMPMGNIVKVPLDGSNATTITNAF